MNHTAVAIEVPNS